MKLKCSYFSQNIFATNFNVRAAMEAESFGHPHFRILEFQKKCSALTPEEKDVFR
jgi:hypothetical protein